jgi:hypothetical protein
MTLQLPYLKMKVLNIITLTLKRKTVSKRPVNFQGHTVFTGRIIADADIVSENKILILV